MKQYKNNICVVMRKVDYITEGTIHLKSKYYQDIMNLDLECLKNVILEKNSYYENKGYY